VVKKYDDDEVYHTERLPLCTTTDATTLRDASPPTTEITGNKCIWSPPTSATGFHYFGGQCGRRPDLLAKLEGRRKEQQERKWMKQGWSNNGRGERDGGGKEGD